MGFLRIKEQTDIHKIDGLVESVTILEEEVDSLLTRGVVTLDRLITTRTAINTTAAVSLYTHSVVNSDFNNFALRLTLGGFLTNTTGGAEVLKNLNFRYGGSTLWNENNSIVINDTGNFVTRAWWADVMLTSLSATSQRMTGFLAIGDDNTAPNVGTGGASTPALFSVPISGITAIDTTNTGSANIFEMMVQFNTASNFLSMTCETAVLLRT